MVFFYLKSHAWRFWFNLKAFLLLCFNISFYHYSYDPKERVAQMNIEGWQFQRIFKHIGQKCSKWTYRVLLSLRYWQVMFNKNPFLLLKWSKNSKIILNPVIIAVLKSLFPCFLIYIFCNFENLINVQALTSHIGGAKSLKKNKRACMFIWVMRVHT